MSIESDFSKLVVNRRDKHILARLDAFHADHRDHSYKVTIVFGAGHMRAIIRHLAGVHGYHVSEGSWITIFGWDMPETDSIAG